MSGTKEMASFPWVCSALWQRSRCSHVSGMGCDADIAKPIGKADILDKPKWLHVTGNIERLILVELYVILKLECHSVVRDAFWNIEESCVAPERAGEWIVGTDQYNNLTSRQNYFIIPADAAESNLVRPWLHYYVAEQEQGLLSGRDGNGCSHFILCNHYKTPITFLRFLQYWKDLAALRKAVQLGGRLGYDCNWRGFGNSELPFQQHASVQRHKRIGTFFLM